MDSPIGIFLNFDNDTRLSQQIYFGESLLDSRSMALVDITCDGKPDVIFTNYKKDGVWYFCQHR